MELIIKSDGGKTVHSTNEWEVLCPPLGHSDQWVDKRSAKELAKSVFETGKLPEIINEVLSDMNISLPSEMWGVPEKPTRLPWGQCGKRKHDLWLYNIQSKVAVSIEAKTDESFDRKLSQKSSHASSLVFNFLVDKISLLNTRNTTATLLMPLLFASKIAPVVAESS